MEYISLREAAEYCNYSQDYLKLRARQGKLNAIKIGRNWATTREWIEEYSSCGGRASATKFSIFNFQFSNILRAMLLFAVILITVGIFMNFDIFSEYFQWQAASIGEVFNKGLNIIPERVVEIK